jgi:hypothetical protein
LAEIEEHLKILKLMFLRSYFEVLICIVWIYGLLEVGMLTHLNSEILW